MLALSCSLLLIIPPSSSCHSPSPRNHWIAPPLPFRVSLVVVVVMVCTLLRLIVVSLVVVVVSSSPPSPLRVVSSTSSYSCRFPLFFLLILRSTLYAPLFTPPPSPRPALSHYAPSFRSTARLRDQCLLIRLRRSRLAVVESASVLSNPLAIVESS